MAKPTTENEARIGKGTVVRAKIAGSENLVVEGRLEGSLELAGALVVESTGIVKANVKVERATISGILVGDIHARDSVQIAPQGRVLGDIRALRLAVAEGAKFSGTVEMMRVEPSESATIRPEVAAPIVPHLARPAAPRLAAWGVPGPGEIRAPIVSEPARAVVTEVAGDMPTEHPREQLTPEPRTEIGRAHSDPPYREALSSNALDASNLHRPAEGAALGVGFVPPGTARIKGSDGRKRVVVRKRV